MSTQQSPPNPTQPYRDGSCHRTRVLAIRVIESCIQALVIAVIGLGWYTSFFEIGVGWLVRHEQRHITAVVYMTTMGILFPCLIIVYLQTCSGRPTHSVPNYIAPETQLITEPYECPSDASLNFCVKDNCKMRWKPPGAHHCSTCGVCRIGFDHHCPWLGNCVTTGRLKVFLFLLVLTSVTVPLASLPILPVLRTHVVTALTVSHADAWATAIWWNRLYSWIFCGGPAGRWIVGTLLGFRMLREHRITEPSWFSGSLVAQPHARLVILVGFAILLWLFAVVMTITVATDVTRGQTTLDSARFTISGKSARTSTTRFVCIPSRYSDNAPDSVGITSAVHCTPATPEGRHETRNTHRTYPILAKERVYDLGWRENWRRVMAQPLFDHGMPCQGVYKWPKMNPAMIQRMQGIE